MFNDTKVQLTTTQKHVGLILDSRLDFNEHIDYKMQQNYRNNEKTFIKPVKKKLANNIQILRQAYS